MKRTHKREAIAYLIAIVLLISVFSTRTAYAYAGRGGESFGYGYGCLPGKLQRLYEEFAGCATAFTDSEAFLSVDDPLSDEKIRKALTASMSELYSDEEIVETYDYFRWDNPCYFWLARTVTRHNAEGRTAVTICVGESFKAAESRIKATTAIENTSSEWIGLLSSLPTDDERCEELHRLIVEAAEYVYEEDGKTPGKDDWSHSMAGVFAGRGAVCEGYSATFAYILKELGIECIQVCGRTHIWNAAYIGQDWYYYDVTWDDLEDDMNYFAKSVDDEEFLLNHRVTQVDVNDYSDTFAEGYRLLPWEKQ